MSNNKICDVICVHEEKVNYALKFLKEENSTAYQYIIKDK